MKQFIKIFIFTAIVSIALQACNLPAVAVVPQGGEEEVDETRKGDREVVPVSTSPSIGTAIKPSNWVLSIYISVVNPLTTERTSTNPIRLTCP